MGNEGSSLGPPDAEQEAQAPCEMPRLNAQDRRLLRLSVVEQLLIVGPPPGVDFAFSLDDCIDEASAAQREHAFVRRAMDRLCQPGVLPEEVFWRNYFYVRRSGALPTLSEKLCDSRASGAEAQGSLAEFDIGATGCAFLAEQALKDHPYLRSVRDGLAKSSIAMDENEFWRRYFALLEEEVEFGEMLNERCPRVDLAAGAPAGGAGGHPLYAAVVSVHKLLEAGAQGAQAKEGGEELMLHAWNLATRVLLPACAASEAPRFVSAAPEFDAEFDAFVALLRELERRFPAAAADSAGLDVPGCTDVLAIERARLFFEGDGAQGADAATRWMIAHAVDSDGTRMHIAQMHSTIKPKPKPKPKTAPKPVAAAAATFAKRAPPPPTLVIELTEAWKAKWGAEALQAALDAEPPAALPVSAAAGGMQMPADVAAELRALPGNACCADCGGRDTSWASVSFGSFVCLECSGVHRGLGVHISFVRSVAMDSWTAAHIRAMRAGGNGNLKIAFAEAGVPADASLKERYESNVGAAYRERVALLTKHGLSGDFAQAAAPEAEAGAAAAAEEEDEGAGDEEEWTWSDPEGELNLSDDGGSDNACEAD